MSGTVYGNVSAVMVAGHGGKIHGGKIYDRRLAKNKPVFLQSHWQNPQNGKTFFPLKIIGKKT